MRIPTFQDPQLNRFFVDWEREIEGIKRDTLKSAAGNRSVLLYSPSKKVYEITVDDSGVLHVTQVAA